MWRIIDDFWDNWSQLNGHFALFEKWITYMGPGYWPDGDMLPLGRIGIRAERGDNRMSMLTKDEQYTMMSLFLICRSPLMFGGNLPDNDEFTLNLITNEEALAVLQKSKNNKLLFHDAGTIAWMADDPDGGAKYVALFYTPDEKSHPEDSIKISLRTDELGFKGTCKVHDLWAKQDIGEYKNEISLYVRRHGSRLLKISEVK